jgi:hypothetical protein
MFIAYMELRGSSIAYSYLQNLCSWIERMLSEMYVHIVFELILSLNFLLNCSMRLVPSP